MSTDEEQVKAAKLTVFISTLFFGFIGIFTPIGILLETNFHPLIKLLSFIFPVVLMILHPLIGAGSAYLLERMFEFSLIKTEFKKQHKIFAAAFWFISLPIGMVCFFCYGIINRLFK